jgi:hypothetical protein
MAYLFQQQTLSYCLNFTTSPPAELCVIDMYSRNALILYISTPEFKIPFHGPFVLTPPLPFPSAPTTVSTNSIPERLGKRLLKSFM